MSTIMNLIDDRTSDDYDLKVEVERQTDVSLLRRWIGVIGRDNKEIVRRRSVILCVGTNEIKLFWSNPRVGSVGVLAALFDSPVSTTPITQGAVRTLFPPFCAGDSATLIWTIEINRG